jgi:hypothetical protein
MSFKAKLWKPNTKRRTKVVTIPDKICEDQGLKPGDLITISIEKTEAQGEQL